MHKVSRSLLLAGVLAFGTLTAACGDKVEIIQPTSTPPGITSITVTPPSTSVTLVTTGAQPTVQFVASVIATGGAATTVTWSSSNPGVATVNATTGVATAVSAGTTSIIATAGTAPATVQAAGTLIVNPASTTTQLPATVTISSVTQNGLLFPVQLNNVAGQIDVTLNVETGTQKVDSLQLTVDGQVVASQRISAAVIASGPTDATNAAVPVDITLSFNTAIFDTLGVCPVAGWTTCFGGVRFTNGVKQLGARIFVNGVTTQPAASNSIGITFNNVDGFYVSQTALNNVAGRAQPNSASDAAGRLWFQGGAGISVRSVPVMYSGRTVASRTLAFTSAAGVGGCGGGCTLTPVGAGVRTDIIPLPATLADTGIVSVPNALATDGNAIILVGNGGAGVINAQVLALGNTAVLANATIGQRLLPLRVDNAAPATPGFILAGTGTTALPQVFNWVNAPYLLSTGVTVGADAGVGLVNGANAAAAAGTFAGGAATALANVTIAAGAATAATSTWTNFPAANSAVRAAQPTVAPTDVNLAYSAQVTTRDLLGNASAKILDPNVPNPVNVVVGAVTRGTFGVDTLPPSIRYSDATGAGAALAAAGILSRTVDSARMVDDRIFEVDYIDDRAGFVGSGAFSNGFAVPAGSPQFHSVRRLSNAAATPRTGPGVLSCAIGTLVTASGTCTQASTPYGIVLSDNWVRGTAVSIDGNLAGDAPGYYLYNASVRDMAGNTSATVVAKQSAVDPGVPNITGFLVPSSISGGGAATFTPTADDDLEITAGQLTLNYAVMNLVYPFSGYSDFNSAIGVKWDGTLTTPVQAPLVVNNFIDQIETVNGVDAPVNTAATSRPGSAIADVRDVFGTTTGAPFTQAILASAWTQPAESWALVAGQGAINRWRIISGTRTTITMELVGPTGQSTIPFPAGSIQLWSRVGAGPNHMRLDGTYTVVGVDNGTNRIWTVVFTPNVALAAATTYDLRALGIGNQIGASPMLGNALATNNFNFTTP